MSGDKVPKVGIAARLFDRRRHGRHPGSCLTDPQSFVVGKPESLVFSNRSAGGATELVLPILPFGLVGSILEEVGCEPGDVRIGMPVEVCFEKLTDEIDLPVFRPADMEDQA